MLTDLPIGAHLTSPRWGYAHHGLYAGAGRVIHYAGLHGMFQSGLIEEVALEYFALGNAVQVRAWVAPKFSGEAAIERARARLGENRYSFWDNNCEHFAQWCISGTSRSEQVDSFSAWLRKVLNRLMIGRIGAYFGLRASQAPVGARRSRRNDLALQGERQRRDDRNSIGASV